MINLVLSVEKLNDVSICPLLYYYKHELRKVSIVKPDYLEEGELMHEGLRIYYQSKIEKKPIDFTTISELARNYAAKNLKLSVVNIESTVKDMMMYFNYYGNKESWEIEAAEEPFAKVLYEDSNVTFIVNGKTDLRAKTMNGQGPRIIVDHKYEAQFREKSERDNQPLAYSWAYETSDFVYNRIGKQQSYTPEKRLQRPYFSYGKHQIEEWRESAIEAAFDILRYTQNSKFPMRFTGCRIHGNKCTFHDVCSTTPDNREYKLKSSFVDRENKTVMER